MSTTTVNLGYVPKNRGEYSSTASYYKDNIVQYNGSSYICNPPGYDPDTAPTASITGVAPYDSDPAVPNTGWAVFCNDSSGVGEGVYNVSVDHTTDNNPKVYVSLSAALQDIPQAKKKGGMEIRFIFNNSNYAVDKEEGITTQPAGTAITSSPTMVDGTYKASQLVTYFSTLPTATGAGNAVIYYKEVDGTYTTWTITLQSSDNSYVQYRLTKDEWDTNTDYWEETASENNINEKDCGLAVASLIGSPTKSIPIPILDVNGKYYLVFTLSASKTFEITIREANGGLGTISQTIASSKTYIAGTHIIPFVYTDADGVYLRIGESSEWSAITSVFIYKNTQESLVELQKELEPVPYKLENVVAKVGNHSESNTITEFNDVILDGTKFIAPTDAYRSCVIPLFKGGSYSWVANSGTLYSVNLFGVKPVEGVTANRLMNLTSEISYTCENDGYWLLVIFRFPAGTYGSPSFTINITYSGLTEAIGDLQDEINNRSYSYEELEVEWDDGKYFNGLSDPVAQGNYNGIKCHKFSGLAGKTIRIYAGPSTSASSLYIFTDSEMNQIDRYYSINSFRENPKVVTVPNNVYYVCINLNGYEEGDKVEEQVRLPGLSERVAILEKKNTLTGKKIVLFGDSLSEFKDASGKRWSDYAANITGAEIINCAIGGTQLRQRSESSNRFANVVNSFVTVFDPNKTYQQGDYVYYKPDGSTTMNCYSCAVSEHNGAWDANDFTEKTNYFLYSPLDIVNMVYVSCQSDQNRFENQIAAAQCIKDHLGDNNIPIIERLMAINWSEIDLVIILAGGNDYGENKYGTPGLVNTNVNETYGAVNQIINYLCTKYKTIPICYISNVVRWFNYSGSGSSDSGWCDNYTVSGGTLNYTEFIESLMQQYKINHVLTHDLYNTLSWNKYNFSNYFNDDDGTHPLKGFKQIAQSIVNFLLSHYTMQLTK